MRRRLPVAPPTVAYVTVVLTTLTAFDLGQSSSYGNANSRCFYMRSCVHHLSEYERLISGGNVSFSEAELEEACSKHDDINVCVRRARSTCVADNAAAEEITQTWLGINASLTYLCRDAKKEFLQYNVACFGQPRLVSSIRNCNKTFHMEKEMFVHSDRDVCRLTKTFLQCLYDQTAEFCSDSAAAHLLTTIVRLMRQPAVERQNCLLCGCVIKLCPYLLLVTAYLSTQFIHI